MKTKVIIVLGLASSALMIFGMGSHLETDHKRNRELEQLRTLRWVVCGTTEWPTPSAERLAICDKLTASEKQ